MLLNPTRSKIQQRLASETREESCQTGENEF